MIDNDKSPVTEAVDLAPFYYRDNFLRLCGAVRERYGDLLHAAEAAVLDTFDALPFDAQCLYVRLVARTGPWFRESRLDYPEIGPAGPVLDTLLATGMVECAEELDCEALGRLFTRAELQTAFGAAIGEPRCTGKADLVQAIGGLDAYHPVGALAAVDNARIVAPLHSEFIDLLELLFFGNRHQGLTEFVLEDLGVTRYYNYPLDRVSRKFASRDAVEEYLACARLADCHAELLEAGMTDQLPALAAEVSALAVTFESSTARYQRLCNSLARDLERLDAGDLALSLYARSARHPARERRARILEKQAAWDAARALCVEILGDPWCEAEQEAAARILPRVLRRLGGVPARRARDSFAATRLVLPRQEAPVELAAAGHLQAQWSAVHYVENSLMGTLFGLAFWEEIFAPLPGVFHHAYQGGPSDLFDSGFRTRREEKIAARMAQLHSVDLAATLAAAHRRYRPCRCHWVDWRTVDEALVTAAARIIPRAHLLAVFERMLFDPRENRRGFPDLIALGANQGDYCLIEVKGPGDTLQDSQKRWLRFFAARDIPAQVARVTWADD